MSVSLTIDGRLHRVTIARRRPHLVLLVDGKEHEVTAGPPLGDGHRTIAIDGREVTISRATVGDRIWIRLAGRTFEVFREDPFSRPGIGGPSDDTITAPMPGIVVSLHRQPGETVTRGEPIVTIESMKLQTALASPRDGVIAGILCSQGETFEKDAVIVTLESDSGEA